MLIGLSLVCLGVVLTADRSRRCETVLRTAMARSTGSLKASAIEAEIESPQFTRQLQGVEGSLHRLYRQPDAFWQWLAIAIVAEFGVPAELQHAQSLAAAVERIAS